MNHWTKANESSTAGLIGCRSKTSMPATARVGYARGRDLAHCIAGLIYAFM